MASSRVERNEYQQIRSRRTVSPAQTYGSSQNVTGFDNNLDNLLEDLQSTITRPGSALGQSGNYSRYTQPITEYATDDSYSYTSPDGTKNVKSVKKEMYSIKTSNNSDLPPERIRMQNNINQLDSLLDDLQTVKQNGSNNTTTMIGNEPGYQSFTSKSKFVSDKKTVERDVPTYSQRTRSLERIGRDNSLTREIESYRHEDYNDRKSTIRTASPAVSSHQRSSSLSRNAKVANVKSYPVEVIQTTSPDINPEILANLDPELLPSGNTKVTTTIKTYTYEIPGSGGPIDPHGYTTTSTTSSPAHSTPSKSFIYNKYNESNQSLSESHRTVRQDPGWSVSPVPQYATPASPISARKSQPQGLVQETTTHRNYQPGNNLYPEGPNKQTYIYNEMTTTRHVPEKPYSPPPPQQMKEIHVTKESTNHSNTTYNGQPNYPNGVHPEYHVSEIIENFETQASRNNTQPSFPPNSNAGPGYQRVPGSPKSPRVVHREPASHHVTTTTYEWTGNSNHNNPPPPIKHITNVSSTTSTSTNTTHNRTGYGHPYPQYIENPNNKPHHHSGPIYSNNPTHETQVYPRKFPTDQSDGAPRDVDELMKNIGAEPPTTMLNASYTQRESEMVQQRKEDLQRHQQEMEQQRKHPETMSQTKNVAGPPVYYPPGHEMFARKEESGGWRKEGEMAKESGKYKYEAESKSKSKSSSGAAVVPICLPLCCGLPCTIL